MPEGVENTANAGLLHEVEPIQLQENAALRYRRKKANQVKRWKVVIDRLVPHYHRFLRKTHGHQDFLSDPDNASCDCQRRLLNISVVRFDRMSS